MVKLELTGHRFGRLVALFAEPSSGRDSRWRCRCDCGNEIVAIAGNLRRGHTKSCGCFMRERSSQIHRKHGQSNKGNETRASRLYNIWCLMRARCNRVSGADYPLYGGRGIRVCSEWDSFEAFEIWALSNGYEASLSIDRIDNDGGYGPTNCRWATAKQQVHNSRKARKIPFQGRIACLQEIADQEGVSHHSLGRYLNKGLTAEEAVAAIRCRGTPT